MTLEASADFETRSDVDLKRAGAAPYFASPRFAPLILAYSIDGSPAARWTRGAPCPADLRAHIESGGLIRAFNASFERQCFNWLAEHCGWPAIPFDRYRCTLAQASALGLPRSLEKLGAALNLEVKKDKRGAALIRLFSVPNKHGAFNEPEGHPQEFAEFVAYCVTDTLTEMEAHRRMMPLSDAEQKIWELDALINSRGIRIDRRSAMAAISLIEKEKLRLDAEMAALTGGAVGACTQVARLTAWCEAQGVTLAGVAKDDILEALDLVDLPDVVRQTLLLRQEAGKSSTSKLKSFIAHAGADDRVRGSFVYHGAAPGRWCLAEGSLVLVKTPSGEILEKPIENVDAYDLVWDGDSWVAHGGVVFSGKKNVITHDGVTATPEHIVYLDKTRYTTLGEAKRLELKIYESRPAEVHDLCGDLAIGQAVRRDHKKDG